MTITIEKHSAIDRAFHARDTARCRLGRLSPIIVMTRKQRIAMQRNAFELGLTQGVNTRRTASKGRASKS